MEDSDMYDITKKAIFETPTQAYQYVMYYPTQGSYLNRFTDLRATMLGKNYNYSPANAYLTVKADLVIKMAVGLTLGRSASPW